MKTYSIDQVISNPRPILDILLSGGLVVAPTDTSYGILVDATNQGAVSKLFQLKDRDSGKAISVFVSGFPMMEDFVDTSGLQPSAKQLIPGAYTFILPSKGLVCKLLEAEDSTLGIRYVKSDMITNLVKEFGRPLTATSANVSGKSSAYSVPSFINQLSKSRQALVDAVIDGGELPRNPPSTVVRLTGHNPEVLRSSTRNFLHHKEFESKSLKDTENIANDVYQLMGKALGLKSVVILLDGELGSGKTTWTKFFAKNFGIGKITSPTFNYELEYELDGSIPDLKLFRHFDLYNITCAEDLASLKLNRLIADKSVNVIEWPAQIENSMLDELTNNTFLVRINLEYVSESSRKIVVNHN